jgi:hypothetical protein
MVSRRRGRPTGTKKRPQDSADVMLAADVDLVRMLNNNCSIRRACEFLVAGVRIAVSNVAADVLLDWRLHNGAGPDDPPITPAQVARGVRDGVYKWLTIGPLQADPRDVETRYHRAKRLAPRVIPISSSLRRGSRQP